MMSRRLSNPLRRLPELTLPVLVLHGAEDPLIPVAAAHDLQRRIRGARLEIFGGMGHDLPRAGDGRREEGGAAVEALGRGPGLRTGR